MKLGFAPAVSVALLAASNVFAATMAQAATPVNGNPFDIGTWVEKLGTVGFAIWMVLHFQKRSKEDKDDLKELAKSNMDIAKASVAALEKNAEGYRELAMSIQHLSERIGR